VQSTTLALMAAMGEIEQPDCAIFADTGWEPPEVYRHLDRLERALPFAVHRVSRGDIRTTIATGHYEPIPWHMAGSMGRRQCTHQFKLRPLRAKVRELLGGKTPKGGCEMLIGITTDEAHRMKTSSVAYIRNTWPLIELRMSRGDCKGWLARHGWTAPRSACGGCPFLSDEDWRARKDGQQWPEIVSYSRLLAPSGQFMHRSLRPIDEVVFSDARQPDLFGNECEGMCGV